MHLNTVFEPAASTSRKLTYLHHIFILTASFLWIFYLSSILSPRLFGIGLDNFWFDADVPRYICQAVDRFANDHWRNKVHPLFSLLTYPLPNVLKIFGIDIISAIRLQLSLVVAVGCLFLSLTFQQLHISKIHSILLIAITLTGATSLTWFSIPESYAYSFSAFCILLFLSSTSTEKPIKATRWISAVVLAFSITITNIAVAIWAALQSCGIRRALVISVAALAAVSVLAVAQRLLFPASGIFFLPSMASGESSFLVNLSLERIRQVLALFFIGSLVFPDVHLINDAGKEVFLTVQHATWGRDSLLPAISIALLSGLLLSGIITILRMVFHSIKTRRTGVFLVPAQHSLERLSVTVMGSVLFLVSLHLFYGTETFVYTGSFLPFVVLILAIGITRLARYSRAITTALLTLLLMLNSAHGMREWHLAVNEVLNATLVPPTEKAMARNTCEFVKRKILF
jgi:hypothetical protein